MLHLAHSKNTSFSRSLLAGFACGIVAALLNVTYGYFYRTATDYSGAILVEPLVIFIAFPLIFIIGGFIFFEMVEFIKRGGLFFTLLFLLLMLIAIMVNLKSADKGKEGLLLGMILITGLLMSFLLPFLATHAKIFMDKETYEESD
jgi:drug/metabolite transporter (DMT)-like permease